MYKKIILAIIFINALSTNVHSMINDTNNSRGFYFSTYLSGQYEPADGNWNAKFFYRMPMIDNDSTLFHGNKLEVGIQNNFGLADNKVGVYVDINPIYYFGITFRVGMLSYYSLINGFGFYTFNSPDIQYNADTFTSMNHQDKNGYFVEAEPSFKVDIYRFTLSSSLKIVYEDMGTDAFYYDRSTYLLRKDKTVSLEWNSYFMFNILPVNIGVNYKLVYLGEYSEISHKLGIAASFFHDFSHIISAYGTIHVGQYLSYNYLQGDAYIEVVVGIQVKIF